VIASRIDPRKYVATAIEDEEAHSPTWFETSALGHEQTLVRGMGMSALPPEADMLIVGINVCYVP